jgi:hypothetical protein
VTAYFQEKRKERLPVTGGLRNAPTCMRSWLSMFKFLHWYSGGGKLEPKVTLVVALLKQWEKDYQVTRAAVLDRVEVMFILI